MVGRTFPGFPLLSQGQAPGQALSAVTRKRSRWVLKLSTFISFLLIPGMINAVELSGYCENTAFGEYFGDEDGRLLDASKLRIDIAAGGDENELELVANVNLIAYYREITLDLTPYLPDNVARELEDSDEGIPTITIPQSRVFLDNAYLAWRKGPFRLRLGRQQLSWGPGYSFNPTDLFHRKEMLDPTYEKEGAQAMRLDYRWGIGGQLAAIAVPEQSGVDAGYAVRLGTHITTVGYDAAVTLHRTMDRDSYQDDSGDYQPRSQRRYAAGWEFSGGLLGLGVWCEGNYNWMAEEDDFIRAIAGIDYTLHSGIYLMVEGLWSERGEEKPPYPTADWMAYLWSGEPLGRSRLMLGIRKGLTGLTEAGLYLFGSEDGSFVLNPRLDFSIAQNANLTLFGAASFGDPDSQFRPGMFSITARGTVYF